MERVTYAKGRDKVETGADDGKKTSAEVILCVEESEASDLDQGKDSGGDQRGREHVGASGHVEVHVSCTRARHDQYRGDHTSNHGQSVLEACSR